jgi:hypothetical protein
MTHFVVTCNKEDHAPLLLDVFASLSVEHFERRAKPRPSGGTLQDVQAFASAVCIQLFARETFRGEFMQFYSCVLRIAQT